jgi:hypothetical protein
MWTVMQNGIEVYATLPVNQPTMVHHAYQRTIGRWVTGATDNCAFVQRAGGLPNEITRYTSTAHIHEKWLLGKVGYRNSGSYVACADGDPANSIQHIQTTSGEEKTIEAWLTGDASREVYNQKMDFNKRTCDKSGEVHERVNEGGLTYVAASFAQPTKMTIRKVGAETYCMLEWLFGNAKQPKYVDTRLYNRVTTVTSSDTERFKIHERVTLVEGIVKYHPDTDATQVIVETGTMSVTKAWLEGDVNNAQFSQRSWNRTADIKTMSNGAIVTTTYHEQMNTGVKHAFYAHDVPNPCVHKGIEYKAYDTTSDAAPNVVVESTNNNGNVFYDYCTGTRTDRQYHVFADAKQPNQVIKMKGVIKTRRWLQRDGHFHSSPRGYTQEDISPDKTEYKMFQGPVHNPSLQEMIPGTPTIRVDYKKTGVSKLFWVKGLPLVFARDDTQLWTFESITPSSREKAWYHGPFTAPRYQDLAGFNRIVDTLSNGEVIETVSERLQGQRDSAEFPDTPDVVTKLKNNVLQQKTTSEWLHGPYKTPEQHRAAEVSTYE